MESGLANYELVGIVTHLFVLAVGVGGMANWVPLPRGRRSGLGLVLMALSMFLLMFAPRWQLDFLAAAGHAGLFFLALWLLLAPPRAKPNSVARPRVRPGPVAAHLLGRKPDERD